MIVERSWLAVDALVAAERLLGCRLVQGEVVLRVTEVEAYRWPGDTANHCRMGRTARNTPMWGRAGHAYVYLCYGIHHLLNVVCGELGEGTAVLIRGCEPESGADIVATRRGGRCGPDSLAGPGKVGAGLALDLSWSGRDLLSPGALELHRGDPPARICRGPRVGVDYAHAEHRDAPWRLADADSPWVSHRKTLVAL